jgi:ribosome recycling factor
LIPPSFPAVEKAIRTSNLGFNPMHDGKVIRVPIPPMTEERRRDTSQASGPPSSKITRPPSATSAATATKHVKKAAKDKLISADDEKRASEEVQQLTDAEIRRIEEVLQSQRKRSDDAVKQCQLSVASS